MSVTILIIIATGIFSVLAWNDSNLYHKYIFNPYKFYFQQEYWRLPSSGFLHIDWSHLIFNMLSLYFFGEFVESYFGFVFQNYPTWVSSAVYLGFYVVAIVVSDIHSIVLYKNIPHYQSLGASGAVSAVVFASIWISPLDKIYFMFIPVGIPGFIYGMLYLIYCNYQAKMSGDNVNHLAHFFGAIFGIAFIILISPSSIGSFIDQIVSWRLF